MRDRKEKAVLTATVFLVLALSLTMGATPAQAITWGQEDTLNNYANVGAVVYWHEIHEEYRLLCSGTLIGDDVFLTAAHCTETLIWALGEELISEVSVSFSQSDPLNPATHLPVEEEGTYTHPDYNPYTALYDVGVLILEDPVEGITPEPLPSEGYLDVLWKGRDLRPRGRGAVGAYFTVVGYGGTLTWPPPVITYEDTRSFASSQFQALLKTQLVLSQNYARGNGGTCFGDSGGPVFWENGGGTLVAVTSWGDPNCVAIGFYCRVDVPVVRNWLLEYIA